MNGKELFSYMSQNKMPPRIPFVPTIYEHSAKIINSTPSLVAKDEKLITKGQLASYNLYKHDLISVGIDIYNVEVEALGAKVNYYNNEDLPSVNEVLVTTPEDILKLKVPNPEKAGRMPIYLNASEQINKEIGSEVIVNGSIVGPFTLAAILRGYEDFIMDILCDPQFAIKLISFANKVSLSYGKAFIKRGLGLSINESWIAPPLLSPNIYCEFVSKVEKELIYELKDFGAQNVALISGGNTTAIAPEMIKTGTSMLMADYNTDQKYYKELCARHNISLRASIQAKTVEMESEDELRKQVKKVIDTCGDYNKFIFGCGVVSYNTPTERVMLLKSIVEDLDPRKSIK